MSAVGSSRSCRSLRSENFKDAQAYKYVTPPE